MDLYLPQPAPQDCEGDLHPMAVRGILLFNAGEYWHAHEALEKAWLEEAGQIRHLYRAILQVGVTYFHIKKHNYAGALKIYSRSQRWLRPFPDECRGIDLARLRSDVELVMAEVIQLGPNQLDQFKLVLLRPIYHVEGNPW